MSGVIELCSSAPEQTLAAGAALGRMLRAGDVLALCGPLGSGKTQFVKGVARGLDIPRDEPVVSPTFVLVREYVGRLRLCHCDAFRIGSVDELLALGLDELRTDGAVVAIEWADRFPGAFGSDSMRFELEHEGEHRRHIRAWVPDTDVRARLRAAWSSISSCA
ncbi:MAG: tRNA (adenosine(37)-N6)-threonylcarbamoyltransferase complex ATPase subunit type 1 TsaE [Phycisphaerae bacterium]